MPYKLDSIGKKIEIDPTTGESIGGVDMSFGKLPSGRSINPAGLTLEQLYQAKARAQVAQDKPYVSYYPDPEVLDLFLY